jgi:hypothetical protein
VKSLAAVALAIAAGLASLRCAMATDADPAREPSQAEVGDAGAVPDADVDAGAVLAPPLPSPPPAAPEPTPPVDPTAVAPGPVEPPSALEEAIDTAFPEIVREPVADEEEETLEPVAELLARSDHGRHAFVLARAPTGHAEPYRSDPADDEPLTTYTWKLLDLLRARDATGGETFSLHASLTLVEDFAAPEDAESDCTVPTQLRARDVDRDGELELTAIVAAVIRDYDDEHTERECVVHAVIAGADDLAVAFRVEREHRSMRSDGWSDSHDHTTRTWRFEDVDQDGHPDIQLVRVTDSALHEFSCSCDFDAPPSPEHHERNHGRLAWTCPYSAALDSWVCPPDASLAP